MYFHYMTYMATPLHKSPCPNFGRSLLGHHNYTIILGLSDVCLGVEKKFFNDIMQFHYMTYMATPLHKNPCPRVLEIYNFGRPFLGHHCYKLGLSDACPLPVLRLGVEKKMFLRNTSILQFLPQNYLPLRWEIFFKSIPINIRQDSLNMWMAIFLREIKIPSSFKKAWTIFPSKTSSSDNQMAFGHLFRFQHC